MLDWPVRAMRAIAIASGTGLVKRDGLVGHVGKVV